VGDWVLVHAGLAITVLDEAQAKETYELLAEMAQLDGGERPEDSETGRPEDRRTVGPEDRKTGRP
jgi:hypothetical protein